MDILSNSIAGLLGCLCFCRSRINFVLIRVLVMFVYFHVFIILLISDVCVYFILCIYYFID